VRLAPEAGAPTSGSQRYDGDDGEQCEEDQCREDAVAEYTPGGGTALLTSRAYTPTKHQLKS